MSHLSRRYTEHYYVEENGKLVKKDVVHVNSPRYIRNLALRGITAPVAQSPNAVFPCQHEERGFVSAKGKHTNKTHARWKRKNKARVRARKQR